MESKIFSSKSSLYIRDYLKNVSQIFSVISWKMIYMGGERETRRRQD